jgi:hypothetical protein
VINILWRVQQKCQYQWQVLHVQLNTLEISFLTKTLAFSTFDFLSARLTCSGSQLWHSKWWRTFGKGSSCKNTESMFWSFIRSRDWLNNKFPPQGNFEQIHRRHIPSLGHSAFCRAAHNGLYRLFFVRLTGESSRYSVARVTRCISILYRTCHCEHSLHPHPVNRTNCRLLLQ